jgi:hypothetical protein
MPVLRARLPRPSLAAIPMSVALTAYVSAQATEDRVVDG